MFGVRYLLAHVVATIVLYHQVVGVLSRSGTFVSKSVDALLIQPADGHRKQTHGKLALLCELTQRPVTLSLIEDESAVIFDGNT